MLEDPEGSLSQVNHCVFVEVRLCPLGGFSSSRRVGIVARRATMPEVVIRL